MRKPEDVVAQLNSWDSVPDELYKRGIKGTRDNCELCPIATFLCLETGMDIEVSVSYVEFADPDDPSRTATFDLSTRASLFIQAFDDGEYPDLDENPEEDDECV